MKHEDRLALTRREREKKRHHQEILHAAMDLLLEQGYENITMQKIADRAEFAVGTLYRFFKSKTELFKTLMLQIWCDVESRLNDALDRSKDEMECLREYNRVSAMLVIEYKALTRIYYKQMHRYSLESMAGLEGEIRCIMDRFIDRLEEQFRSGIQRGLFVDVDPHILAISYDAMVGSYMTLVLNDEKTMKVEEWVATTDRIFFQSVVQKK